ncbi:hypothetical protein [Paracoccus benzoatiresistens]|uniref:Uncharacterized protein n=1 Tax=Paracoccus benzoatiresistens TaxID=2997341 RepID=A0ABT4J2U7_9RHOB|nr:hypothetical protein [Paracoccus sp. EF6]MCZ0961423.1 hypothetical protein [Paracoccus sp. EF6]
MTVFRAALIYYAIIFACGTVLGIVRNMLLVPRLGSTAAVALEIPVMLALSWLVCGAILGRLAVPAPIPARIAMGATALALLWLSEALLAMVLGAGASSFFTAFTTPAGALGALAQLAFAAFPVLRRQTGRVARDDQRLH